MPVPRPRRSPRSLPVALAILLAILPASLARGQEAPLGGAVTAFVDVVSYSGKCHPAPIPSTNRPPLISSRFSAIFAMMPGWRKLVAVTKTPSVIFLVTAARAARVVQPSQTPRRTLFSTSSCMMKWSATQHES